MNSKEADTDDDVGGRVVRRQNVSFNARAKRQVAEAAGERVRDNTDGDCNGKRLGKLEQLWLLGAREHRHQTDVTLKHTAQPAPCSVATLPSTS